MPDEAPTNSAGDGGPARTPTPPWESADATSPDQTDKAAEIIPPWESADAPATPAEKPKSVDELFERRVREAAQEVADDQAQPHQTDSPLGVYADLDQAKALADTEQAKKNIADEEANFKKLRAWQVGK